LNQRNPADDAPPAAAGRVEREPRQQQQNDGDDIRPQADDDNAQVCTQQ